MVACKFPPAIQFHSRTFEEQISIWDRKIVETTKTKKKERR